MTRILAALALAYALLCAPAEAHVRHKNRTIGVPITITGVGKLWAYVRPLRRR